MIKLLITCLLTMLLGFQVTELIAQNVKVQTTSIEDIDNKLVVKYEIIDSKVSERFNVSIEITSSTGQNIQPNTITGDVGNKISGGPDKQIVWDYAVDGFVMKGNINIEVIAIPLANFSLAKSLFLSTLYPGLGIYKIDKKKPYLLFGVAGYGCLATSIFLNIKANDNYNSYLNNTDDNLNDDLLTKSQSQNNLSKTLAYSTIGIWGINLIWTAIKVKQKNNLTLSMLDKQLLFYSAYDPNTRTNSLMLRYRF